MRSLVQELQRWPQLLYVGVILSLENLLTLLFWLTEKPVHVILSPSTPSICWPSFPLCEDLKLSPWALTAILTIYGLIAAAGIYFWLCQKYRAGIISLWLLVAIKIFIIFQDYRLTGNYHYLPIVITLCFLLVPHRAYSLTFSFFLVYFTSALLKFDPEWLSGAAIDEKIFPDYVTQIGVWYVLILETIFIFFLFSKRTVAFHFVFLQLIVFHLFSWHLTRFFFPSVMLLTLGILLIARQIEPPLGFLEAVKRIFSNTRALVLLALFVVLQLPQYLIPGDAALTGEGRMYALIMYDGRTQCQPYATLWKSNNEKIDMALQPPWVTVRTRCDPFVYMRLAEHLCTWTKKDPSVIQVDLYLPVKTRRGTEWQSLVAATNVCEKKLTYSSFLPNSWIQKPSNDQD